jgi:hypothetical protein
LPPKALKELEMTKSTSSIECRELQVGDLVATPLNRGMDLARIADIDPDTGDVIIAGYALIRAAEVGHLEFIERGGWDPKRSVLYDGDLRENDVVAGNGI